MSEDTTDELMRATYRALCERGYAALTMRDIADECSKSKATLHYHFDGKHDLLVSFLEFLDERFARKIAAIDADDPTAELFALLDVACPSAESDDAGEFQTAMLELTAQAPYEEEYRERLLAFESRLRAEFEGVIDSGVESGAFDGDVDPERTAEFLLTAIDGAQTRRVAVGHDADEMRQMIYDYVQTTVLADESPRRTEVRAE
ncbi:TetR/AcrR family transcriptional regulator [Haloprofundus sp. MHR1]|uniref:TetR/AcrR family transcriptional regulator n=1 Tax=Haloprofundus sp. MHR1 TaxID=2572921 RepID=UPI0010BF2A68|nr:TetR/AcrR family transcriptional regulator [Haloprofundus sp. MHR1]QCJ46409.1 TetR family transcriptional regulator [Haloprofundus sp. MHR1]